MQSHHVLKRRIFTCRTLMITKRIKRKFCNNQTVTKTHMRTELCIARCILKPKEWYMQVSFLQVVQVNVPRRKFFSGLHFYCMYKIARLYLVVYVYT